MREIVREREYAHVYQCVVFLCGLWVGVCLGGGGMCGCGMGVR